MKPKIAVLILMAAAMLCSLTACVQTEVEPTPWLLTPAPTAEPTAAPTQATPEPEPERRVLVTTDLYSQTFLADDGVTELLYASYAMPVVTVEDDPAASGSINSALAAQRERFLHSQDESDTSVDYALGSAQMAREQGYTGPAYAMEYTYSLPRVDAGVLSVLSSTYIDLGGPHPNTAYSAMCFDLDGNRILLADLSDDAEGFAAFCAEKVLAMAERDEADGRYFDNYKELIRDNIRDGLWYFSAEGLTFIYNTYDIGTHAAGMFEFTIPYGELAGVMDAKWLPADAEADGTVACDFAENTVSSQPLFTAMADPDGAEFVFTAQGCVRSVQVAAATDYGYEYLEGTLLAGASRLDDGESFSVRYMFPGDLSCLVLRYTSQDGEQITRRVLISGEDGSVLLAE